MDTNYSLYTLFGRKTPKYTHTKFVNAKFYFQKMLRLILG